MHGDIAFGMAIANWLLVQWVRKDMGMVCVIVEMVH